MADDESLPLKYRIHRVFAQEPEMLKQLERDAVGMPKEPDDALKLAFREGVRWRAAYWLSLYREVENERAEST